MQMVPALLSRYPVRKMAGRRKYPLPPHSLPAFGYFLSKAFGSSSQDPDPWDSVARLERNRAISFSPISTGWRLLWKKMNRLIQ
jgi:hypothetical protein